ncbi:MAG TPA: c-type cytochrome domain-containing protein [Gemmataceae bacterium]
MNGLSPTPTPAPRVFTLRELPLPVRLTLSLFLLAVGAGYLAALVQLHFQHASKGNPLPTPDDVVARFSGKENFWSGKNDSTPSAAPARPVCQLECLIMGPEEGLPFNGEGSMAKAFFKKESTFKKTIEKKPHLEPKLRSEREGERLSLQAWINAPPEEREKAYEEDAFTLPENLCKRPLTEEYRDGLKVKVKSIIADRCFNCHGTDDQEGKVALDTYEALSKYMEIPKPVLGADGKMIVKSKRQMSIERLTESTHLHALSFAVLFTLTGLVFAFSSYPVWIRCFLAPLALLAQIVDLSCWWLARLEGIGPYFALAIMGTGAVVGAGLMLQIVLSLFNMYRWPGKVVLLLLFAGVGAGGACLTPQVREYLKQEIPAISPSSTSEPEKTP